jgi:hypothetical protein
MLDKVCVHFMKLAVNALAKELCSGCKDNQPGQLGHMTNGCLSEDEDLMAFYGKRAATDSITAHLIAVVYTTAMKSVNRKPSPFTIIIAEMVAQTRVKVLPKGNDLQIEGWYECLFDQAYQSMREAA